MNSTQTSTTQPIDPEPTAGELLADLVDESRRVVSEALRQYADASGTSPADADLALTMAANVVGWTHTTRLRGFLEQVAR